MLNKEQIENLLDQYYLKLLTTQEDTDNIKSIIKVLENILETSNGMKTFYERLDKTIIIKILKQYFYSNKLVLGDYFFNTPKYEIIYKQLKEYAQNSIPFNLIKLSDDLDNKKLLEKVGGRKNINNLFYEAAYK